MEITEHERVLLGVVPPRHDTGGRGPCRSLAEGVVRYVIETPYPAEFLLGRDWCALVTHCSASSAPPPIAESAVCPERRLVTM